MKSTRTRFCCPRCRAPLTPWLRALELADAVCLQAAKTWLVPAGWFVRRDSELLRTAQLAYVPNFPWMFAPLTNWWLNVHPDPMRTNGCCGLSFFGPDSPNLLCACGHEVGIGYRDCLGPHWYALHESVGQEDTPEDLPPIAITERLARVRERVENPLMATAHHPGGTNASISYPDTWHEALHLADMQLEYGGGIHTPALVMTSPQLPTETSLIVPIPWCQIVRALVLDERPWGELALPLTWTTDGLEEHQVHLIRRKRRLLLTLWVKGQAKWAVTISPKAWLAAWARLRD